MQKKAVTFQPIIPLFLFLFLSLFLTGLFCEELNIIKPPTAERIKKELTIHGHTRIDYYYWLQERKNPKVKAYLQAENDYTDTVMKRTGMEALQQKLYKEIIARLKQVDISVPYKSNGYCYYERFETGNEYPIHCRKKGSMGAKEEVLLDVNEMAKGYSYYRVTGISVSPDNRLMAFGVDTVSRRKYTIHFKNLVTGEILEDKLPNTDGRAAWANDNKTIFYAFKDETLRPYKIMKHRLGQPTKADKEIFHETDKTFRLYAAASRSKRYIFIVSESTLSTEYRFLDANRPDDPFSIVHPREKDLRYSVEHLGKKFYIRTNWQAKNFRLMQTPVQKTFKEHWTEVIPHRKDVFLEGIGVFNHFLVLQERKDGLIRLRCIKWQDMSDHYIDFGEETYTASISKNPEIDTDLLRFTYNSLTTPDSTFEYDMNTRARKLLKQEEVKGDFNPGNYRAERRYAAVRDGTRVPISLVYRKGLEMNGDNPLLLEGYGAYGSNFDAEFKPDRLSLLDRGFVWAIAHIRGGQEMGRDWYENGKMLKKKNTFTDFIDCAQYLIKEKFTNPDKLIALGGSAGGLLMGAVTTMRPDLFKGVIAEVPWMDVVTCMLDETVPLTTNEFDEWGNPVNKEHYDYMLSYSPYDNIAAGGYPAMLVTTGFHDSQVQYWDPAKWVAKLRATKTDNNLLLFFVNMDAGHGGASGRFRKYEEIALEYAFMLYLTKDKREFNY